MSQPPEEGETTIRACTYNIRYAAGENRRSREQPWADRCPHVLERIRDVGPDILAVQEALPHQFDALESRLSAYDWHGVGRRDGDRTGEFVPIAWREDRFTPLETGAFWLSSTPEKPSVGWDGDLPRVSTWALLEDRQTELILWACATHFDHRGERARVEAARVLEARAHAWLDVDAGSQSADAVLVMGDCNCRPDSPPYAVLADGTLTDAHGEASTITGPAATFHGFDGGLEDRIDYLWTAGFEVETYGALEPRAPFASDHIPVWADLRM